MIYVESIMSGFIMLYIWHKQEHLFFLENYLYCLHGYVYEKEERTWWLPIFTMLAEDKEDYVSVAYALGTLIIN
jgi:hypothetical protein